MAVIHKVSVLRDAEMLCRDDEFLWRKQLGKFVVRPAIEFSFLPFAVGVLGGKKSATRMRHVAEDVVQNIFCGGGVRSDE